MPSSQRAEGHDNAVHPEENQINADKIADGGQGKHGA